MYFHKVDAPSNFRFKGAPEIAFERLGPAAFRLRAPDARWPAGTLSMAGLDHEALSSIPGDASLSMDGGVIRLSLGGKDVLRSSPDRGPGRHGKKWILCFDHEEGTNFYGLGEKNLGFDRSGRRTIFWNTDAFADFHWGAIGKAEYDPAYASIPVLIVRKAGSGQPSSWTIPGRSS
jgi:alpha-glucosidase